jgi:protein TonB
LSGLIFVTLLHAMLINVLINALGKVDKPVERGRFTARVIEPDKEIPALPPPTPPIIERPPPLAVSPVPTVVVPPPPGPRNVIADPDTPPAVPGEAVPAIISEIPPRAGQSTQTGPIYPAISRRLGEEGSVRLRLTIGTDGSVIDASVVGSSGFQRLDEAAIRWVRRNWRYEPATRGDMPIEATAETTLTFRLE